MKQKRIKMLEECIDKINEISSMYTVSSSGYILSESARCFIGSLHYLENRSEDIDEMIGVKEEL